MKKLILPIISMMIFFTHDSVATGGGTSANSVLTASDYKMIEFSNTRLGKTLPIELEVEFNLACEQELIKVGRTEYERNGQLDIVIYGIVKVNKFIDCHGFYKVWEKAGHVTSGRMYQIRTVEF